MSNKKKWPRDARNVRIPFHLKDLWLACRKIRSEARSLRDKQVTLLDGMNAGGVPVPPMEAYIEVVYQGVLQSMPYMICERCEGSGECEDCNYKGWLSKYEYDKTQEVSD